MPHRETFVKQVFSQRSPGVMIVVEKTVKICVEWCGQNAKKMIFNSRHENISDVLVL